MAKTLTEIAAEIVAAQVGSTSMTSEEVGEALKSVFKTLVQLRMAEGGEEAEALTQVPAALGEEGVSDQLAELRQRPIRSIRKNKVICLECGAEFKQLTKGHLKEHDMDAKEYRKKYGFKARQPLSAQSLSAKRRQSAKERNLGEVLKEARRQGKGAGKKAAPKKAAAKGKAKK
ncbi:MucR family transcriptional regulator [Desulfatibacillum aliphaticivorans]|uniref:Transcriptional regulator, MucR family n=1 Tax=Desulfatibacillum aliphaticivorans TaxID=218208 RepID=B8FNL4_DESAL|nr:MucR family transcriptional regulator [Desulfatibacillum aliphaticivorans]ACL06295.1 transcriptional regulator, MucR family [Desulfatibacillum aliphaticivorans]